MTNFVEFWNCFKAAEERAYYMSEIILKDRFLNAHCVVTEKEARMVSAVYLTALNSYILSHEQNYGQHHKLDKWSFFLLRLRYARNKNDVEFIDSLYRKNVIDVTGNVFLSSLKSEETTSNIRHANSFLKQFLYEFDFGTDYEAYAEFCISNLSGAQRKLAYEIEKQRNIVDDTIKKHSNNIFSRRRKMKLCSAIVTVFIVALLISPLVDTITAKRNINMHNKTVSEYWMHVKQDIHKVDMYSVYWTEYGKSYHSVEDCVALSRSKDVRNGALTEAITTGHGDPCSLCVGD